VLHLNFSRIQSPDLMPADIVRTNIVQENPRRHVLQFQPGPIFANVVLADEINRATPRHSPLLEAMQDVSVSVGGHVQLEPPFLVLRRRTRSRWRHVSAAGGGSISSSSSSR
jgi:MoxR-like ATPase